MKAADLIFHKLTAARIRPIALAKAIDVSPPTASMMLSGKRGIPMKHVDALATLLEISLPELFTERAESTHAKKADALTSPDTPHGVLDPQTDQSAGGTRDATAETETRSTSQDNLERRVDEIASNRQFLVGQLYASADTVRRVADALRLSDGPPPTRSARSARPSGSPDVRRSAPRKKRRA